MTFPKWFVQTADLNLHGYQTLEILLIDLRKNAGEPVTILEQKGCLLIRYEPVTEDELRRRVASSNNP